MQACYKVYPAPDNDASNGFGRPDVNRGEAEELRSVDSLLQLAHLL
jgi:hypothetical protein